MHPVVICAKHLTLEDHLQNSKQTNDEKFANLCWATSAITVLPGKDPKDGKFE